MDEQSKKGVADDSGCTYWRAFAFLRSVYVFFDVPDWQKLDISRLSALAQTSSMYDMNGELMSELRGLENRIIVSLDEIPLSYAPSFHCSRRFTFL